MFCALQIGVSCGIVCFISSVNSGRVSKTTQQDAIDLAIVKQLEKTDTKIDETSSKENTSNEIYLYC